MAVRRRAGLLWRRGGPHPLPQGPTPLRHRSTEHSRVPDCSNTRWTGCWSQELCRQSRLPTGSSKSPGGHRPGRPKVQSQKRTSLTNVQAAVPEGVVSLPGHLARCHRGLDRHASKILRVEMGSPFVVPKGHRHRHGSDQICSTDRHHHGRTNRVVYRGRSAAEDGASVKDQTDISPVPSPRGR